MVTTSGKYAFYWIVLLGGSLFFLSGCALTKTLEDNEKLHLKSEVNLNDLDAGRRTQKQIAAELSSNVRPKLKYGIGNFKVKFYSFLGKPKKEKGLKAWLSKTFGEPPFIFDPDQLDRSRFRLLKVMLDEGYFDADIRVDSIIRKQKVTATYAIEPGNRFFIRDVHFPDDTTIFTQLLQEFREESSLKPEDAYRTSAINVERTRLSDLANDNGFLAVNKSDFIFFLDTIPGEHLLDVYIQLAPTEDSLHYEQFFLGETLIFEDFSLEEDPRKAQKDTSYYEGLKIIRRDTTLLPHALDRTIPQREGELYSKTLSTRTLNRLLDLRVYKFVNLRYQPTDTSAQVLSRLIYLTAGDVETVSFEILANTTTRTGNNFGTGVALTYSHLNLFKGAEVFEVTLSGEVRTQFGETNTFVNSIDAGLQSQLILPYYLFRRKREVQVDNPQTQFGLNYIFERRIEFYTISSFGMNAGYAWTKNQQHRHRLTPISINRVDLLESTPRLDTVLMENPTLRASFESVYIPSLQYVYNYNNRQQGGALDPYFFMRAGVETAGNLAYLTGLLRAGKQDEPYKVFGLPFSQFIKLDLDARYHIPRGASSLVFRVFGGIGISYGNTQVMPYVKQYFSGGANGLRAFQIRTVGPGSYVNIPADATQNEFIDQTGDIKLEANVEYRFPLVSYLKGAVFLDAGNIWLLREDEGETPREGGVFKFNKFYKEIAAGAGLGFRLDISSFVIRLDIAFPISKPYLPEGERLVIHEINFLSRDWRRDNLNYNIGLGYPF